jgi:hypothetical protein
VSFPIVLASHWRIEDEDENEDEDDKIPAVSGWTTQ